MDATFVNIKLTAYTTNKYNTVFLPDGLEIDVPPRNLITLVPNYFSNMPP
ncbi:hypothetical protein Tfer_0944 [Thermincola ferriacetica]|uniref:Uncharacterized protein n=1 Tax=Thermincola ferriacetica TaxID=281456 RepID=A0A0L6W480_9FIRM|nr:hypothetical protein Tfer_0944 [Thermincola ferriacetica]